VQREDGSWLLDGLMSVDEVAALLDMPAPKEVDVQTLGGLAMTRLGRIPSVGDRFAWQERTFEIVDMDGRRVDKVLAV
jgi:putative hemolysin